MIKKLNIEDKTNFLNFVNKEEDPYQDFYITCNRNRLFFKNNLDLIEKILTEQKCYGWFAQDLLGIMVVYEEKGFRTYIKILSSYDEVIKAFLNYINFNYKGELFLKVKKTNPQLKVAQKLGYVFAGGRGKELLLKKGE